VQAIAREIGLPGNGFVWPVAGEPRTFHLRFLTPQQEGSSSSRTSSACAHALFSAVSSGEAPALLTFRIRLAQLTVERQDGFLWLTLPLPSLRDYPGALRDIAAVLHLSSDRWCQTFMGWRP
jgi:predicted PhzF superfamily epimerase YddE/YHI9